MLAQFITLSLICSTYEMCINHVYKSCVNVYKSMCIIYFTHCSGVSIVGLEQVEKYVAGWCEKLGNFSERFFLDGVSDKDLRMSHQKYFC